MDCTDELHPSLESACFGGLPGEDQTVPRAELMAVIQTMKLTGERPVKLYSDNKYVVDGFKGSRHLQTADGDNQDLWAELGAIKL